MTNIQSVMPSTLSGEAQHIIVCLFVFCPWCHGSEVLIIAGHTLVSPTLSTQLAPETDIIGWLSQMNRFEAVDEGLRIGQAVPRYGICWLATQGLVMHNTTVKPVAFNSFPADTSRSTCTQDHDPTAWTAAPSLEFNGVPAGMTPFKRLSIQMYICSKLSHYREYWANQVWMLGCSEPNKKFP